MSYYISVIGDISCFPRDFYSCRCISLFFYNLFRLIARPALTHTVLFQLEQATKKEGLRCIGVLMIDTLQSFKRYLTFFQFQILLNYCKLSIFPNKFLFVFYFTYKLSYICIFVNVIFSLIFIFFHNIIII